MPIDMSAVAAEAANQPKIIAEIRIVMDENLNLLVGGSWPSNLVLLRGMLDHAKAELIARSKQEQQKIVGPDGAQIPNLRG